MGVERKSQPIIITYRYNAFVFCLILAATFALLPVQAISSFQLPAEGNADYSQTSSSTNCVISPGSSVPPTTSRFGGETSKLAEEDLSEDSANIFGFASIRSCSRNGFWCSCNYPCSTADCCSGVCSGNSCVDAQCDAYPDYPNYCDGSCYSCSSIYDYFTCDPWDGAVCCPSDYPYYCHIDNSCWSSEYLPNPCGSGCPPGETECNGDCWTCSSGTLCCPSSGDPYECCGSGIDCQSDGNCCNEDGDWCPYEGTSSLDCCEGTCANDNVCGYPECFDNGDCPSDGWVGSTYCSGGDVWRNWRNHYCYNDGDHDADCRYSDSGALYEDCGSLGCSGGVCNTCKPDGQSCSQPGSSTAECCSGICQINGVCGLDDCTNECVFPGLTQCASSTVQEICAYHDADICLEWGGGVSCQWGCQDGSCFDCPLSYCEMTSDACCDRPEVCQEDNTCNINCDPPDPDCCTDECPYSGATQCFDTYSQEECGYWDADACLDWGQPQSCQFGCVLGSCFECTLSYCLENSADCCQREEVCQEDDVCNLNCEYGSFPDLDCAAECGDGVCGTDEDCAADCIKLFGFVNPPDEVTEGQEVTIEVLVENTGDVVMYAFIETAIVPHSWAGTIYPSGQKSTIVPAPQCCPGNEFYDAYAMELDPNDMQTISFSLTVPTHNSYNHCGGESAWDPNEEFNLISGLYEHCGSAYTDFMAEPISMVVVCDNDGLCDLNENSSNCPNDCPCDLDGICDQNEAEEYCPQDCGCNFNDICESHRAEDNLNCPSDCSQDCIIPDGSSYDCDCDSDADCAPWGDYYCDQVSGPDSCEMVEVYDECSNHNDYFCEDGWVKRCMLSGSHYIIDPVEDCNNKFKYCDPDIINGFQTCSEHPHHMDLWIDHADTGVKVNKKRLDIVKVNIYSDISDTINLSYDETKFTGTCPQGAYVLSSGVNTCELTVLDTATLGATTIAADDKQAQVKIIYETELVIATDSEQLNKRYSHQERAVGTLLKSAYAMAESDGLVYDLSWYDLGVTNPFSSFSSYNEKITGPQMMDNKYSLEAAQFLKGRCDKCGNIMILGDDFVLPHYRRAIPMLTTWFLWFTEEGITNIYTDIAYTKKHGLQWYEYYEMFMIDGTYEGKDVMIILPDTVTPDMRTQIDSLKQVLIDKEYNPQFEEMDGSSAYCVDESWGSDVKGKTLIIIGNEDTNNAFLCMPFVSGDLNEDVAFLQPNVWDNDEYAMVFNTMNESVIEVVVMLMESGEIANLRSHEAYVFHVGAQYGGYAAMIVGGALLIAGTGGTAAPAVLIAIGVIADAAADGADLVDTCVVNYEGAGWCAASAGFAVLPYVPSKPMKQLIKAIGELDFFAHFGAKADFVDQQLSALTRSKAFDTNDLKRALRSTTESAKADELLQIAQGRKMIGDAMSILDPDTAAKKFKALFPDTAKGREHALLAMKRNGYFKDAFETGVDNIKWVQNTRLQKGVMRGVSSETDVNAVLKQTGFIADVGGTRNLEVHVIGIDPSSFISTSYAKQTAIEHALKETSEGYVFFINPRSSPGIDVPRTINQMPEPDPVAFEYAMREAEIAIPDFIHKEDILGVRKIGSDGWLGEFEPNNNVYLGDIDEDMVKLFGHEVFS